MIPNHHLNQSFTLLINYLSITYMRFKAPNKPISGTYISASGSLLIGWKSTHGAKNSLKRCVSSFYLV